jgi:phospholipase C
MSASAFRGFDDRFASDFARVVEQSEAIVRLSLDKAAAHLDNPREFPIADPDSIEGLLAAKLKHQPQPVCKSFAAAAAQRLSARARNYAAAASVDPSLPTAILPRALAAVKPAPLTLAAENVKRILAQLQLPETRLPLHPPQLVPTQVELHLLNVHCTHKTRLEFGQDEIQMAATGHDVYHRQDNSLDPFSAGKFKNGERIANTQLLASFPVLNGALGGMVFPATLYLAEKDFGGFRKSIDQIQSLTDHEMQEIIALALSVSTTSLLGLAEGADIGFAHNGLLAAIALGLAGSIHIGLTVKQGIPQIKITGPLRSALRKILSLVIGDGLRAFFKDDIFPPQPAAFFLDPLNPDTQLQESVTFQMGKAQYEAAYEWRVKMAAGSPTTGQSVPTEASTTEEALRNLQKIEHIVVLMLENRSFDHMLGYLSLDRARDAVDGLQPGLSNPLRATGEQFPVHPLDTTAIQEDPGHSNRSVGRQLWGSEIWDPIDRNFTSADSVVLPDTPEPDNSGFVDDFHRHNPDKDPSLVMGYHQSHHVPAFDLLVNEFALCNRWFSAFPGNTWVNRTIALTGRPALRADNQTFTADNDMPFDEEAFTRVLDDRNVDWAWYAQDVPSLVVVDASYADNAGKRDKLRGMPQFFEDLRKNRLPSVCWLDPNFVDIGTAGQELINVLKLLNNDGNGFSTSTLLAPDTANDDHPPTDITHGQNFVLQIFLALFNNSVWEKTLFLVTYDEHGGFYDHVPPPVLPVDVSEGPAFKRLGMRVPALIVSPWVGRGLASNRQFDHTSIIRTIFERFCRVQNDIPPISRRVDNAEHLGWLLNEAVARTLLGATAQESRRNVAARQYAIEAVIRMRVTQDKQRSQGVVRPPTDLQQQMAEGRKRLLELLHVSKTQRKIPAGARS